MPTIRDLEQVVVGDLRWKLGVNVNSSYCSVDLIGDPHDVYMPMTVPGSISAGQRVSSMKMIRTSKDGRRFLECG